MLIPWPGIRRFGNSMSEEKTVHRWSLEGLLYQNRAELIVCTAREEIVVLSYHRLNRFSHSLAYQS